jgi:hypothetical protein
MTMFKYSKEANRILFRSRMKELQIENEHPEPDRRTPRLPSHRSSRALSYLIKHSPFLRRSGFYKKKGVNNVNTLRMG